MKKRIKQISIMSALLILGAFIVIGCTPARRPVPQYDRNRNMTDLYDNKTVPDRYDDQERNMNDFYDNDADPDRYLDRDVIDDNMRNARGTNLTLEREIESMAGVRDAVVIIDNNTAYVGIETDTKTNMNTMQKNIANKIRNKMPNISKVYVTSETDRVGRLRDYTKEITGGRPVRDFIDRIEDLF